MGGTLQQARTVYFEENGFGPDGGYASDWVDFKLGPVPLPFPNTNGRRKAVRYHDLHHILTGYRTDVAGEFEISAWEVGASCRGEVFAWFINLPGMVAGLLRCPVRTFRAFVRGRRSNTLYGRAFEPLLDQSVGEVRRQLGLEQGPAKATVTDAVLIAAASAAGLLVGLIFLAVMFTPLTWAAVLISRVFRERARRAEQLQTQG